MQHIDLLLTPTTLSFPLFIADKCSRHDVPGLQVLVEVTALHSGSTAGPTGHANADDISPNYLSYRARLHPLPILGIEAHRLPSSLSTVTMARTEERLRDGHPKRLHLW